MNYVLFIFTLLVYINTYGQENECAYKKFEDTLFEPGDKILAPEIRYHIGDERKTSSSFLDSIQIIDDFLKSHPHLTIEIGVHTDHRGSKANNLKSSLGKANSIKSVLITRFGINPNRIYTQGYGETAPLFEPTQIEQLQSQSSKEIIHARNRRVELKILE